MRLFDILKPGVPCEVQHPQVGKCKWQSVDDYFMLYFAEGPEEGDPLVADEAVLLEDTWTVIDASKKITVTDSPMPKIDPVEFAAAIGAEPVPPSEQRQYREKFPTTP